MSGSAAQTAAWIVLAMASMAQARSLYVSPAGTDSATGTMIAPFATPGRALEAAQAGDTVFFRTGRYAVTEMLSVDKAGVTLAAFPGGKPVLAAGHDERAPAAVLVILADRVVVRGLEIRGGSHHAVKIDVNDSNHTDGVQIKSCRIGDSGADCIKSFNADKLLIEDCEIGPSGVRDPSNAEGIDVIGSQGVTVRRCFVHDTATNGVYFKGGTRDGLVEACRIQNTGKFSGILLGQDTDEQFMRDGAKHEAIDCAARNNVIIGTGAAGLGTYSGSNVRFENNTLVDVAKEGQAAFWVVSNRRNVPSQKVIVRNNIVVAGGDRPMVFLTSRAEGLQADCNLYYSPRGSYVFRRDDAAGHSQDWDWEGWRREMKADARSRVADPMLEERDGYRPRAGSPALGAGEGIAELKSDCAGRPRPAGGGFDLGAYQGAADPARAKRASVRAP